MILGDAKGQYSKIGRSSWICVCLGIYASFQYNPSALGRTKRMLYRIFPSEVCLKTAGSSRQAAILHSYGNNHNSEFVGTLFTERGTIRTVFFVCYALTSFVGGYVRQVS